MSTYQYYEFQAVDRPLTEKEMAAVRASSTRARVTPTSFANDYAWGDFRGDEKAWMEKYFDAFLHLASWGTRVLSLRLPARLLDAATARPYCVGGCGSVRESSGKTILTWRSEEETGGERVDGEGQLSRLIPVRSDLARGDLRALYLGWLLCAESGELDDDAIEPPVPAGLGQLTASLKQLVDLLRIDVDLVGAAATASPLLVGIDPTAADARQWVAKLPVPEKDDLLARLMTSDDATIANELLQRMRRERDGDRAAGEAEARRRTVAELVRAGEQAASERSRVAAEKAAKEKERRDRAAASARAKHLDQLAGREPTLWQKAESLIAAKLPKSYDEAVELLVDLRDIAARKDGADFRRRLEALRIAHERKRTFIERLDKAGL